MPMNADGERVVIVQRVLAPYNVALYRGLADRGAAVTVVHGQPQVGEFFPPIKAELFPARAQPLTNGYLGSPWSACWQHGLIRAVLRERPTVVVVEGNPRMVSTLILLIVLHFRRVPALWWTLGARNHPVTRFAVRLCAGAISYSEIGASELREIGARQVAVAANATQDPLAADAFAEDQQKRRARGLGERTLLFVGKLIPEKRVDRLIESMSLLDPCPHLIIAGDGPDRRRLEALAQDTGLLDDIKFVGATDAEMTQRMMRDADLFVLPGTGGLAIQEATAVGLPCVVGQSDGTQLDLIGADSGWLLKGDTLEELVATLTVALKSDLPAVGARAHARSSNFSLSNMIEAFGSMIDRTGRSSRELRIVWITPNFRPAKNMGGSQEIVAELAEVIAEKAHVTLITTDYPGLNIPGRIEADPADDGDIDVIRLRHHHQRPPQRSLFIWQILRHRRVIRQSTHVYLSELRTGMHLPVAVLCRLYGIPFAVIPWGSAGERSTSRAHRIWDRSAGRVIYGGARKFFVQTAAEAVDAVRFVPPEKVALVPLGIPVRPGVCDARIAASNEQKLTVVCVARLNPLKGIDVLIEAVALVGEVELTIIGGDEGSERTLRDRVAALGIGDRVRFAGPVYPPRIDDFYRRAEIFLLAPVYNEGTSLASLDAALWGCAPMLSDQVSIPGMEDGLNGFAVEPDPASVRAGLDRALACRRDGTLTSIRKAARELARSRDVRQIGWLYVETLGERLN